MHSLFTYLVHFLKAKLTCCYVKFSVFSTFDCQTKPKAMLLVKQTRPYMTDYAKDNISNIFLPMDWDKLGISDQLAMS